MSYPRFRPFWFGAASAVIRVLVALGARRFIVEGTERVPQEGSLIFVTNHIHYFDSPVIAITLPRQMNIMAAEKYRTHPLFGPILWTGGAIWVKRDGEDLEAVRQALAALKDDRAIGLAVEGTRSETGGLGKGKTGAAYLATRTGATLQPVVVWGTENVLPALRKGRRAEVHVRYGEPFTLPEGRARTAQLEEYTEEIMLSLAKLLPEEYRGVYAGHPALASTE